MKIAAVILAAGGSARMGRPKQLLRDQGETLVRRIAHTGLLAGCDPVLVVTGREHDAIAEELRDLAATLVPNDNWERGMGTSLRAGVNALPAVGAAFVLTCDQPQVTAELLLEMIERQRESDKPIVACEYAGTIGVPVLFLACYFAELRSLGDDAGAKSLLRSQPNEVATLSFPGGAVDLDTPEDYERVQAACAPNDGRQRNPGTTG